MSPPPYSACTYTAIYCTIVGTLHLLQWRSLNFGELTKLTIGVHYLYATFQTHKTGQLCIPLQPHLLLQCESQPQIHTSFTQVGTSFVCLAFCLATFAFFLSFVASSYYRFYKVPTSPVLFLAEGYTHKNVLTTAKKLRIQAENVFFSSFIRSFSVTAYPVSGRVGAEPTPADIGQEAGYITDRLPDYGRKILHSIPLKHVNSCHP